MNTRQLSQAIAQRLPHQTQDQVEAVFAMFVEIAEEELSRPKGYLYIHGLGRLHVDRQFVKPAGVFEGRYRQEWTLLRLYFRFNPTRELKETVRSALESTES